MAVEIRSTLREKLGADGLGALDRWLEEEMAEDGVERTDVERAILRGFIEKKLTHDPRGTRYRIEGPTEDGRTVHVVCRFRETGSLIIITVYEEEVQP